MNECVRIDRVVWSNELQRRKVQMVSGREAGSGLSGYLLQARRPILTCSDCQVQLGTHCVRASRHCAGVTADQERPA